MIYCFDLDGTLCTNTDGEYGDAIPFKNRILSVNKLYDSGNTIIIDTARGATTGINWFKETEEQLKEWGLKYNVLRVGTKFSADIYIDDKAENDKKFFND